MPNVEIKICGLTRREDAVTALELGADYIGFVLYAGSPRGIGAMTLARILDGMPANRKVVAVFVNESRDNVERVAADCGLFAVQIHGDEDPREFQALPLPVWRAVRIKDGICRPATEAWKAVRYVADAAVPGLYGGTGKTADWEEVAAFAAKHPTMLAGGLTPENVGAAIRETRPAGVDVASGVEISPGFKDRKKMAAFISNARKAFDQ